jgi:hypothetical protein
MPAGRYRFRPPRRRSRERVQRANGGADGGQTMADAMQLAIALLTAGLDSPRAGNVGDGRAHSARRGRPG